MKAKVINQHNCTVETGELESIEVTDYGVHVRIINKEGESLYYKLKYYIPQNSLWITEAECILHIMS